VANKLVEFLLRRSEASDRARALEYERARRAHAAMAPADAYADALRRLKRPAAITMGRLRPSADPIDVAEDIALAHAIVVGSTGSGKTRFLIGFLLDQLTRALAARPRGRHELGFETEVIDPKAETAVTLQAYVAALWLRLDDEAREALARAVYTIDWSRDAITPSAPYDNRAQVVSDAYKAHLLTDVTVESSRQVYSEPLRQLLYMWTWLLIDLRFPANFAFAERFFRDEAFRRRILEKVGSSEVRQYFASMKSVVADQTQGAFLRRLHADLSFPENRYAVGVPPEQLDRMPRPEDAQLVIGNFGCSNVLPQSLGLSRATWRAISVLLDAPRRRSRTKKTIVFEELALLLSASTELMEILMTSLRTLRSVGVGLLLASQDLASSLPKNAVRNIVLNTRWSATFQSRADEAEILFSHVLVDPADRRTPAERHRAFLRDVQTMPRQEFWLTIKGGYPALPARSLDLPDPGRDVRQSDEQLAATFHREIGRRSMLSTKEAAEAIAAWEARVLGQQEIGSTKNTPHQHTAHSLDDLLRRLSVPTESGEDDGDDE
jgi:hypothetical protein